MSEQRDAEKMQRTRTIGLLGRSEDAASNLLDILRFADAAHIDVAKPREYAHDAAIDIAAAIEEGNSENPQIDTVRDSTHSALDFIEQARDEMDVHAEHYVIPDRGEYNLVCDTLGEYTEYTHDTITDALDAVEE